VAIIKPWHDFERNYWLKTNNLSSQNHVLTSWQRQWTHTFPVLALSASVSRADSADLVFFAASASFGSVFCVLPVPAAFREFWLSLQDTEEHQASQESQNSISTLNVKWLLHIRRVLMNLTQVILESSTNEQVRISNALVYRVSFWF